MLAGGLVEREIVDSISPETVRRTLKKRSQALAERMLVPAAPVGQYPGAIDSPRLLEQSYWALTSLGAYWPRSSLGVGAGATGKAGFSNEPRPVLRLEDSWNSGDAQAGKSSR